MTAPLIILEGPDCCGKSTLAEQLMVEFDAHYVHFSDERHVKQGLARFYVEGMMPAVLGYRPVIMDRSWLSEEPYCRVFRPNETPRTDDADHRMLERLALSCNPLVVYCKPPQQVMVDKFTERKGKGGEYLESVDQLLRVRDLYNRVMQRTHLQVVPYDWTEVDARQTVQGLIQRVSHGEDELQYVPKGTGGLLANVLMVGNGWKYRGQSDPHHHWPYASFEHGSMSRWFAAQLCKRKIPESRLWWIDHEELDEKVFAELNEELQLLHSIVAITEEALDKVRAMETDLPIYRMRNPAESMNEEVMATSFNTLKNLTMGIAP